MSLIRGNYLFYKNRFNLIFLDKYKCNLNLKQLN